MTDNLSIDGRTYRRAKGQVAQDGEFISRSVQLMDGKPSVPVMHRPGPVTLSDAEKAEKLKHLNGYEQRLTSRWKNPPQVLPENLTAPAVIKPAAPATTSAAAYGNYDKRVSERWRGGAA